MSIRNQDKSPFQSPDSLAPIGVEAERHRGRSQILRISHYAALAALCAMIGVAIVHVPLALLGGLLLGVGCCALIVFRPFVGLLLYLIIFVLRPGEMYSILRPLHLERLVGSLTLVSMFLLQQRQQRHLALDNTRQTRLFLLFLAAVLLSIPFAYWRALAVRSAIDMLKIAALYVMVVQLVDTRHRLRSFTWVHASLVAYLAFMSFKSYMAGQSAFAQGIDRATGLTSAGGNANALGTTMASTLPLLVILSTTRSVGRMRIVTMSMCLLLIPTMLVTGSRASLLGLLAGMSCLWWISGRRIGYAILGLLVIASVLAVLPGQYKERYATITRTELDGSSRSRIETWKTAVKVVIDRPVFGVGVGCFTVANSWMSGSYLSSHNLYLQVLTELGFVGAIVFFAFIAEMLKVNRKTLRRLRQAGRDWEFEAKLLDGVFAGVVVLLVSGVFGSSLTRRTWYVFGAVGAATLRIYLETCRLRAQVAAAAGKPARSDSGPAGPVQPA